jgi:hypothetical protein
VYVGTEVDYGSLWSALWGDGDHLYFSVLGEAVFQLTLSTGVVSFFAALPYTFEADSPSLRYTNGPYGIWGDGVYLYVSSWFESGSSIFRIRLEDRATTEVAAFPSTPVLSPTYSAEPYSGDNLAFGLWGDGDALYVVNLKNSSYEWGIERLVPAESSPPVLVSITPDVINAGQTITATITGFNLTSDPRVPHGQLPFVESADPSLQFGKPSVFGLAS